jgi:hypothetical protein
MSLALSQGLLRSATQPGCGRNPRVSVQTKKMIVLSLLPSLVYPKPIESAPRTGGAWSGRLQLPWSPWSCLYLPNTASIRCGRSDENTVSEFVLSVVAVETRRRLKFKY